MPTHAFRIVNVFTDDASPATRSPYPRMPAA